MYSKDDILSRVLPQNDINTSLRLLYENYWRLYLRDIKNNEAIARENKAQPYFLCASDEYARADLKILFLGQENNDWGGEFGEGGASSPEELMKLYDRFVNEDWGSNSLLWQTYSEFREWGRNQKNSKVGVIASNVVRISVRGIGYDKKVLDVLCDKMNFFQREIEILRPSIVVFASGKYDSEIEKVYGNFQAIDIYPKANLSELLFDNGMPVAYRFCHPNARHNNGKYSKQDKQYAVNYVKQVCSKMLVP